MKFKTIRSSWWAECGYRLDCQPYLQGALEAKIILDALPGRKDSLRAVTAGHDGGIYHAGRETRRWVDSREYGVPFLSSSDILKADLSNLPLISKSQVANTPWFVLRKGYTLITRSGTIGRMAYARPEMDGLACSEHVLRVAPDPDKIPPGYLYAFLSSKFGIPLVVSGTYGSIIQSIEPQHIADIPVPRFDPRLELEIHDLVEKAAELRTKATAVFRDALQTLHRVCGLNELPRLSTPVPFGTTQTRSGELGWRLDTHYHSRAHQEAITAVKACRFGARAVRECADSIVEPLRFKRVQLEGTGQGTVPFFGAASLMQIAPEPMYSIPARGDAEQCRVAENTVLVPRSGQIYGIIGNSVLPIGGAIGGAVTEDAIRITCPDIATAGFLYIALNAESGVRQMKCRAFGGSIPHLDVGNIGSVLVPAVPVTVLNDIGEKGARVANKRTEAIRLDTQARSMLESAIERGAGVD